MGTATATVTRAMGASAQGGTLAYPHPGDLGAITAVPRTVAASGHFASTKTWQPMGPHQSMPDTLNVSGAHRFKYFKRPIIPFLNPMPPDVVFAPTQSAQPALQAPPAEAEPLAKEIATQSDYRESEAQTAPFAPDYQLKPGMLPEVISLATLTYGAGLPATLQEVKMIERAREKRAFEASMPPMTDECSLEMRRTMMSEQELRDWRVREEGIRALQDGRVEQFAKQLRQAAQGIEDQWEDRVEHVRQIKLTEKDKALSAIQRRRIKALRKLADARKAEDAEARDAMRDIVRDYADYSSQVYAPVTRGGRLTQDKVSHRYETDPAQLRGLDNLLELERSLPDTVTQAEVRKPIRDKTRLTIEERKTKKIRDALEHMDAALKAAKQAKPSEKEQKEALLAAYRVVKPLERPPTPQTEAPEIDDAVENAAVLLQRLLRGRAVQNMMFEGKERRLELIQELRAEEAPGLDDTNASAAEAELRQAEHHEAVVSTACEALQAELVSHTLDFLAKELVRFREERSIAELVRQAELTRRIREAEESGRRQVELQQRDHDDAQFREVMKVYNATADTFLADIVSNAVDIVAARQAAHELQFRASHLHMPMARVQAKHDEAKMVVLDIVSTVLFPEVDRQDKQRAAEQKDARFKYASDIATESAITDAAKHGNS